jgi:hypothetical protein
MPEDDGPVHGKPRNMQTLEIIAACRHAYQIMSFYPNAQLARALANFMCNAQGELEKRDAWPSLPRAPDSRAGASAHPRACT